LTPRACAGDLGRPSGTRVDFPFEPPGWTPTNSRSRSGITIGGQSLLARAGGATKEGSVLDQSRENNGSRGGAEGGQFVDQAFEMLHGLDGNFQGERIGTGAAMTFEDFGQVANGFGDAGEDVADHADADEGGDGQADFGGVNLSTEAGDDSGVFHLADALGNGGKREASAATEFGERQAAVLLKLLEDVPAGLVYL